MALSLYFMKTKRTVVHSVPYEFPLDRHLYGQTFVIADHVRHSENNTAVFTQSPYNLNDSNFGKLQRRVARDKLGTELVFSQDLTVQHPKRAYDVSRTALFPFLDARVNEGPVSYDAHYFRDGNYPEFEQIKQRFGDDVDFFVHLHCLSTLFLGDLNVSELTHRQKKVRDNLLRAMDKYSPKIIAVSNAVRDSFYQHGILPNGSVEVVHNGVETDLYRKASDKEKEDFRRELGINASRLVGYVGRIEDIKGADTLLGILSRHPDLGQDVGFVIATTDGRKAGAFLDKVRRDLPELVEDNRIKFCVDASKLTAGFYKRDSEVCRYFDGLAQNLGFGKSFGDVLTRPLHPHLDVYVQPSNSEALGLSVVEAGMSEVPVVASEIGGIPEVVNVNAGTLVPIKDRKREDVVDDFTFAIKHHLSTQTNPVVSDSNRTNLIRKGFDARTMASKLDGLYSRD